MASLNIMAKTYAKIAKTFIGLPATIVAIKKKTYSYSSFRSKICQKKGGGKKKKKKEKEKRLKKK